MLKLSDFMWRSGSGITHAIDPKTQKTYCSISFEYIFNHTSQRHEGHWEPTDILPSPNNQPTCKICRNRLPL